MGILFAILLFFHVLVCLFLVLIILMQRPKQEGLGAAFASGMMHDSFGAQTTDVLQKGTRVLAIAFFVLSISMAVIKAQENRALRGESPALEPSAPAAVEEGKNPATDAGVPPPAEAAIKPGTEAPGVPAVPGLPAEGKSGGEATKKDAGPAVTAPPATPVPAKTPSTNPPPSTAPTPEKAPGTAPAGDSGKAPAPKPEGSKPKPEAEKGKPEAEKGKPGAGSK